jgi:hypothetical protein
MLSTILKDGGGHAALKDRYGEPERGEWMGVDKNSSQRRWRLQQDEHNFQHTSPTYYPSWPRPRNHWNATGPRNQQPTSPTRTQRKSNSSLTDLHRSGWWAPLVRPVPAGETWELPQKGPYTGQTGSSQETPNLPNRPTELQTDPNSKQQLHRTIMNSPKRSPKQNWTGVCTGQTGEKYRSDRCDLGSRDEHHPWVSSPKSNSRSPKLLHGFAQDFRDSRNTSGALHSQDFVHKNLLNQEQSKKSHQELL